MQGHLDSPLTKLGRFQAFRVRTEIDRIDVAYSSPSIRAVETAEIILDGTQKPIKTIPELREINLGIWEGMQIVLVEKEYPHEYKTFWSEPSKFTVDHGEAFHEVQNRAVKAVLDIANGNKGRSILLVSHAAAMKVILAYFEKRPLDKIWEAPSIGNASHSIIEETKDGDFKVVLYGGQSKW